MVESEKWERVLFWRAPLMTGTTAMSWRFNEEIKSAPSWLRRTAWSMCCSSASTRGGGVPETLRMLGGSSDESFDAFTWLRGKSSSQADRMGDVGVTRRMVGVGRSLKVKRD